MNRTRLLLAGTATGAVLAATMLGSPAADASPLSYLQALNAHGVAVSDTVQALTTGYAVCEALNTATGDVVATNLWLYSDIPTIEMAVMWVVVSVEELCPHHDHRGGMLA